MSIRKKRRNRRNKVAPRKPKKESFKGILADVWNKKKSFRTNYRNIGLASDLQKDLRKKALTMRVDCEISELDYVKNKKFGSAIQKDKKTKSNTSIDLVMIRENVNRKQAIGIMNSKDLDTEKEQVSQEKQEKKRKRLNEKDRGTTESKNLKTDKEKEAQEPNKKENKNKNTQKPKKKKKRKRKTEYDKIKEKDDEMKRKRKQSYKEKLEYLEKLGQSQARPRLKRLCGSEMKLMKQLIEKHGDDYKAMERDIKINVYQHTEKKLRNKAEVYLKQTEDFERYRLKREKRKLERKEKLKENNNGKTKGNTKKQWHKKKRPRKQYTKGKVSTLIKK
ncbi:hspc111 protein-related [Anaeramoeba flamelloides]|uniref:Nucleolar protein 16 n=1 Tax=Anaeramoeba flamelloides TaxID=1746091 RepID=A0ABQ8YBL3_9EUKA|nr:hspc111 protein-related [Anaeramoeba flamelloides]